MLRIHKYMIVENEHLYGPGKRLLIFLKGCSIHCDGCINRHLWDFEGGTLISTEDILNVCINENVEGITIHGGEPLDQSTDLLDLVKELKKNKYTIVLFTGYIKKELNNIQSEIWNVSDLVIAGRFDIKKRNVNLQFRGSTNQRVYKHKGPYENYVVKDGFTSTIITIDDNGNMDVTGFLTEDIKDLIK